jgi:Tripartite tricarboxylate transporter TctB family
MAHEDKADDGRTGVATSTVEALVALVLLVIGIVVIVESRRLGAGWTSDGPGAGYFPFLIGLIITVSGAGILYQVLRGKHRRTEPFVDRAQLKRVMSVLIPAVVYVLAVQFVGLYVASAIYIAAFMILLGKYSWLKSIVAALAVMTVFFLMFEVWFKVPLFKGSLDPLRFLGY